MKRSSMIMFAVILILITGTVTVPCFAEEVKKPVAHYTFDGDFKDSSGNGLDATLIGDVPLEEGILGQCARFGNGYLEVADNDLLDFDNAFTVSMWVRMGANVDKENWGNFRTMLIKHGKRYCPYNIFLNGSKEGVAEFDGNDYNVTRVSATKYMELIGEKWYLYTVTFNNGMATIYYDDKLIKTKMVAEEDKVLNKTEGVLHIGQDGQGQWPREFYGSIDDLRLYNAALSIGEVKAMYEEVMSRASGMITLQIDNSKMVVNGKEMEVDPGRNTTPVVVKNRTLVPIRAIIESMGGTIGWDSKERRVDITLKDKTIKLWIDKLEGEVNGEKKPLEVAPSIIKERTMLPLRFVTENLGATLEWDQVQRKAVIRYIP